jgi:hypothetical protein
LILFACLSLICVFRFLVLLDDYLSALPKVYGPNKLTSALFSASASLLPSSLVCLTSKAVKLVPPPRGKSVSSARNVETKEGVGRGSAAALAGLSPSSLSLLRGLLIVLGMLIFQLYKSKEYVNRSINYRWTTKILLRHICRISEGIIQVS